MPFVACRHHQNPGHVHVFAPKPMANVSGIVHMIVWRVLEVSVSVSRHVCGVCNNLRCGRAIDRSCVGCWTVCYRALHRARVAVAEAACRSREGGGKTCRMSGHKALLANYLWVGAISRYGTNEVVSFFGEGANTSSYIGKRLLHPSTHRRYPRNSDPQAPAKEYRACK